MSDSRQTHLSRIRRASGVVEARMRFARALSWLPTALTTALALAGVVLAAHKLFPAQVPEPLAVRIFAGLGGAVLVVLVVALSRRLPPRAGTQALDKHHALSDRLTNALAFDEVAAGERSPLMEVAIDDACKHAERLSPHKAWPIRFPSDLGASAAVGVLVVGVALFEIQLEKPQPTVDDIDPLVMTPDDIELFRQAAEDMRRDDQSEDVKAAIDKFNQLIEDIANRRLERTEAFRRMEAIERELLKGAEADAKALEEELRETGKQLEQSDMAQKLAEAMKQNDLDKAEKELQELAKKLRDKQNPPDKAQLDKLREALKKAAERRKEALKAVNEQRAQVREQLLKKKKEAEEASPDKKAEEERLLKKKERELERLDREAEQRERMQRQLDRLDRELAEAAANLMKELGMSAEDLEQAAEDINRMQQEEMSQEEKEQLRQKLEELREILRQQGQGGQERLSRMLRFGQRARGQGQGQPGQGQEPGQGQQPGQQPGQGQGKGDGPLTLGLGPGGQPIPIPGQGPGQGPGKDGGQGSDPGGKGVGSGRGPDLAGAQTDPGMETRDVEAVGADTEQGPTNSEVILAAAERGFSGTDYEKVFTQYRTVAEENIDKERIPDGYRFYVQRYFQLIRPRE